MAQNPIKKAVYQAPHEMSGGSSQGGGQSGYVPAPPSSGYNTKYLRADGTWQVPPNTTYESKPAASGGTDLSLVTTDEKYQWNNASNVIEIEGVLYERFDYVQNGIPYTRLKEIS